MNRIDGLGSAFLSNVPGFTNVTIGASNINALAPVYGTCQAPITFTNGLRAPTQPSVSNGALHFLYSYFISDGVTYSVQANLSVNTASQFANNKDQLANPYQVITGVTGTRLYTYIPSGQTVFSTITGLSTAANSLADQRFYPYSLLGAAPGVYTSNTAPLFDAEGMSFSVTPSIPVNGVAPNLGTQLTATTLFMSAVQSSAVLNEAAYINLPLVNLQQQTYTLA